MPIPFLKIAGSIENGNLFQELLLFYIHPNSKIKEHIKHKYKLADEEFPPEFTDIVDIYLNLPIDDDEFISFFSKFPVQYMSTGKSAQELYTINPDIMKPIVINLVKSKRIQTLMDPAQGDFLGRLINFIRTTELKIPKEVKELYIQKLKAKKKEVSAMYEPLEVQMATNWADIVAENPEFRAQQELVNMTARGINAQKQLIHERLPDILPENLEARRQMALERRAAAERARAVDAMAEDNGPAPSPAGNTKTGGGRRRRIHTKRRKTKRKQTRRK